jgi:hypothetical protein
MTTASKIIRGALDALSLRGAGQAVDGTVAADLLSTLNTMIDGMNLAPTFAYSATETIVQVPASTSSLTIGPGMQIDIPRPDRIESSSFSRVSTIDYPLQPVDRDTYNSIFQKTIGTSWPTVCFFDGGNPTGNLFLWPQAQVELHLVTSLNVAQFADLTTDYVLPRGYERLFIFALAEECAPGFEVVVPASVAKIAAAGRRMVKRMNLNVPQLSVDLPSNARGWYSKAAFLGGLP